MGKPRQIEYVEQLKKDSAKRLVEFRKAFGLSQSKMAEKLNICRQSLYYYESARSLISVETLCIIYDMFGVTPEWIMGRTDHDKVMEKMAKK